MMQNNLLIPSPLRQQLDILGAQFDPATKVDPALVMTCCRNVAVAATDTSKPLPDDIFAPGVNDSIARFALSGLCMAMVQSLAAAQAKKHR